MMKRAAAVMKGTLHEEDWVFYHDALSVMTSKECIIGLKQLSMVGAQYFSSGCCRLVDIMRAQDPKIKGLEIVPNLCR